MLMKMTCLPSISSGRKYNLPTLGYQDPDFWGERAYSPLGESLGRELCLWGKILQVNPDLSNFELLVAPVNLAR